MFSINAEEDKFLAPQAPEILEDDSGKSGAKTRKTKGMHSFTNAVKVINIDFFSAHSHFPTLACCRSARVGPIHSSS